MEINDHSALDQELYSEMIENYIGNFPLPFQTIAAIAENKALSLHALLMTSSPDGLLLQSRC